MVISTNKQIYMLVWLSFFLYNYVNFFLCLLTHDSEGS